MVQDLRTIKHFLLYPTGNQIMNETKAASLAQENCSDSYRASLEETKNATTPGAQLQIIESNASTERPDGQEAYERGTALKNVGLFRQAAEHFEQATQDPAYALKGFAHMGLCLKKSGKQEEAVTAFRRALQVSATFLKEQVQILYLLGRTLESLNRIPEAMEAYRWLRRESPQYRDVAVRIESLSTRRMHSDNRQGQGDNPWAQQALEMWLSIRARVIHEGSSRTRADAKRDGHSET
jgi:tetratricopeptide (TPR) repeat protein